MLSKMHGTTIKIYTARSSVNTFKNKMVFIQPKHNNSIQSSAG
jgi:hypothetical protein